MFGDWSTEEDYNVGENTTVKTISKEIIEGRVYAYDQKAELLVLQIPLPNNQKQFRFIKTSSIEQTILNTKQDKANQLIKLPPYNEPFVRKREEEAIAKLRQGR